MPNQELFQWLSQFRNTSNGDTFRIGQADLMIHSQRHTTDRVNLDEIVTRDRGRGYGGTALKEFCTALDRCKVTCVLVCEPFSVTYHTLDGEEEIIAPSQSWRQLQAWYRKFGFKGSGKVMIRRPQSQFAEGDKR